MGILSSLFGLNPKEEEKPAVVKVFTKSDSWKDLL